LLVFALVFITCKRDNKGYKIPYEEPFPPAILYISPCINNCSVPYSVTFSDSIRYIMGDEVYTWDFGDGKSYTGKKPTHVYTDTGYYNVTLTITNSIGTSEKRYTLDIHQPSIPIISGFDYSYECDKNYAPLKIVFENKSQHATSYWWVFGDGDYSSQKNPVHTFSPGGNYNVKLYAICNGDSSLSTSNIIIISQPKNIELSRIGVSVPPDTSDSYKLYCKIYLNGSWVGETSKPTWGSYDTNWEWSNSDWYFHENVFTNLSYSEDIEIQIFDHHLIGPDEYLYGFWFNTSYLQNNCYPTYMEWEDGDFSGFIEISYY